MFSVSCAQSSARSLNAAALVPDDAHTGDRCSSSISTSSPLKNPRASVADSFSFGSAASFGTSADNVSASSSDPRPSFRSGSVSSFKSGSSSSSCVFRLAPRAAAAVEFGPPFGAPSLGRSSPP